MEKIDEMVSNITKNQQFQNSVDDILEEKERMDEKINAITQNQIFQNSVDELLEENEIASSIMEENNEQNSVDNIIEENVIVGEEVEKEINEDDYTNSIFYQQYLNEVNAIKEWANYINDTAMQKSNFYSLKYNNPLAFKNEIAYLINIGFPAPRRFIEEYKNKLKETLNNLITLEDAYYEVDILPNKYTQKNENSKVIKQINAYQVIINLKKKTLKKEFTKN